MDNSKKPTANIEGALGLIGKSKNPLTPLYEAMTNSLESLDQRNNFGKDEKPQINISIYFTGLTEDVKEIEFIEIIDNGIGFNSENYSRYCDFFNKSKGYDNRGTGRLQFIHRFAEVEIESYYFENGGARLRKIVSRNDNFIASDSDIKVENGLGEYRTKLVLKKFSSTSAEKSYFDTLTIDDLQRDIRNQFLLRFYLDNERESKVSPEIQIRFLKNNLELSSASIQSGWSQKPIKTGKISVPYYKIVIDEKSKVEWSKIDNKTEDIKWAHFKLKENELSQNSIQLCSKNVPVQPLKLKGIKKNEVINGHRFLTAFFGGILDKAENVSDAVDCFKFPEKKNIEQIANDLFLDPETEYLLMDEIESGAENVLPEIYDEFQSIKKQKDKNIEEIARIHGIPLETALKSNIGLSDDEEVITKKIYNKQSESLADNGFKVKKLFESIKALNPLDDNYQSELKAKSVALSELVDEQDKEELSRYIIRREMVVEALRMILNEQLEHQVNAKVNGSRLQREGIIHDLIFKRKTKSNDSLNDLWVLNEDFVHFDSCSELELAKIVDSKGERLLRDVPPATVNELGLKINKRPDIFLFWEDAKCILVELKQPEEDLSDHLNQLVKYCQLIANYSNKKIEKFYCYLVGENINPRVDLNDYEETVNGDWVRSDIKIRSIDQERTTIALAQVEVIKLSAIHKRAHMRNKSFAEKLGLPELLKPISG